MIVTNLSNDVQMMQLDNNQIHLVKLFTTKLSPDEVKNQIENGFLEVVYNKQSLFDMISEGIYSEHEISNYQPLFNVYQLFDFNDRVEYPIVVISIKFDNDKDDLKLRLMQSIDFTTNNLKVIHNNRLDVIYKYIAKYFGETLDQYYDFT